MTQRTEGGISGALERFSYQVTEWAGSTWAFIIALGITIVWATTGPIFGFSDAWQLVINTGTNIATLFDGIPYSAKPAQAKFDEKLTASHSIEEAQELHERKQVKRAGANSA